MDNSEILTPLPGLACKLTDYRTIPKTPDWHIRDICVICGFGCLLFAMSQFDNLMPHRVADQITDRFQS